MLVHCAFATEGLGLAAAVNAELLAQLTARAGASPRRRQHHNLHSSYADPIQILLNAICFDSYIRPHRHLQAGHPEWLFAVRGRFAALALTNEGGIERVIRFGTSEGDAAAVQIAPSQWHTVLSLEPCSVLLELKQGPFDPSVAKEFAPWSPAEGSAESSAYLVWLRSRVLQSIT